MDRENRAGAGATAGIVSLRRFGWRHLQIGLNTVGGNKLPQKLTENGTPLTMFLRNIARNRPILGRALTLRVKAALNNPIPRTEC